MGNHYLYTSQDYLAKLEQIEKELLKLKKGEGIHFQKKPISLKGILKGVRISAEDIEKAKQTLFKPVTA